MSRSYECYDCGGETEKYDDAYCPACNKKRRDLNAAADAKAAAEHAATIIILEKLGFRLQAEILRKYAEEKEDVCPPP